MNEAKTLLLYALSKKDEDEKSMSFGSKLPNAEIIQACKVISDCLPNDETNMTIKNNLHELLPKMIRALPLLTKTLEMLINTFIDKFVATGEDVAFFYKTFTDEFKETNTELIKQKLCDFLYKLIIVLEK